MNIPTLADVVSDLEEIAATKVDPTLTVKDLDIDSLVLAEWAFSMQERFDVFVDERRFQGVADMTITEIYETMVQEAKART